MFYCTQNKAYLRRNIYQIVQIVYFMLYISDLKTSECNDAIVELLFEYFCTNVSKIKQIHFLGSENATSDMVDSIHGQILKTGMTQNGQTLLETYF